MADMSMESVSIAFNAFINGELEPLERVFEINETISKISEQISEYLVRVSASSVSYADEVLINSLHNNIGDIARVAELADNFTKYTQREVKDNLTLSDGINEKLQIMHQKLQDQYLLVKKIMLEKDYSVMGVSDALEDEIDAMRKDLVAEHIVRLGQGKCRPENNTIFVNLVCNLERIGDHLNFIAHSLDN